MTLDEEIRRARDADRILNDPLFKSAFSDIESALVDSLRRIPIGDRDGQHEVVLMIQLLNRIKSNFTELIQTGKMADIQKGTR
jgi:hypothetical protein